MSNRCNYRRPQIEAVEERRLCAGDTLNVAAIDLYPQSVGHGVLLNVIGGGGLKLRDQKEWPSLIANPNILGTQASLSWNFAEVAPGVINPEVGKLLRPWLEGGKQIVLEVTWKNRGPDGAIGLPEHYRNASFAFTSRSNEAGNFRAPNVLHPDFLPAWSNFNAALRNYVAQLTANTKGKIEFVIVGGAQPNAEVGGWKGEADPPRGLDDKAYADVLLKTMAMADRVWSGYKLAVNGKDNKPWTNQVREYLSEHRWLEVSNGFGVKVLDRDWLAKQQALQKQWPQIEFAAVEYGPSGVGKKQRALFEQAVKTGLHYVPLSLDAPRGEAIEAAKWATGNLGSWK